MSNKLFYKCNKNDEHKVAQRYLSVATRKRQTKQKMLSSDFERVCENKAQHELSDHRVITLKLWRVEPRNEKDELVESVRARCASILLKLNMWLACFVSFIFILLVANIRSTNNKRRNIDSQIYYKPNTFNQFANPIYTFSIAYRPQSSNTGNLSRLF